MEKLLELANNKNFKIWVNTKWLLKNSMGNNMNASDVIIKLIAIENYFKKNDYGMRMYNKMQKIRVSKNNLIESEKANNQENFINLIKSFEKNNFDVRYPIELNKKFEVFEGSHRLACAIYFEIEEIPITFNKNFWELTYDYSLKWFENNGLSEYVSLIKEKYSKIYK